MNKLYISAVACAIIIISGFFYVSGTNQGNKENIPSKQIAVNNTQESSKTVSYHKSSNEAQNRSVSNKESENRALASNNDFNNTKGSRNRTLKYVNGTTLQMFKALEVKFKDKKEKTIYDHFENVRNYLLEQYPREKALSLFYSYKDYLNCKMEVYKKQQRWGHPSSPEEALQRLQWIQDYRNERLGEELTEKLYGKKMQKKEYSVKKSAILKSDELAQEKKRKLRDLRREMRKEGIKQEEHQDNYQGYQQKLKLYDKDLEQMSEEERNQKIKEIRKETFSREVVEKMEKIDQKKRQYKKNVKKYRDKRKKINNNPDLSKEKKQEKLQEMRKRLFGDNAEGFKRRENKRKALQKLRIKNSSVNKN